MESCETFNLDLKSLNSLLTSSSSPSSSGSYFIFRTIFDNRVERISKWIGVNVPFLLSFFNAVKKVEMNGKTCWETSSDIDPRDIATNDLQQSNQDIRCQLVLLGGEVCQQLLPDHSQFGHVVDSDPILQSIVSLSGGSIPDEQLVTNLRMDT
ncbi:hypothetical protein WICPIJ_006024 [Wickerhamomyces pijperi]|uniref:Uncharacterized protein n=1 Tax=Wickerhamomyces pijperi TaxID=599730 RepID=A0A9P8Q4U2_WICPI|nr:hypothetical protein WICPIJ_006024 [Wickerhamomyces pijperi]